MAHYDKRKLSSMPM